MDQLGQKLGKVDLNKDKTSKFDKDALRERRKILGKEPEQAILSAIERSCFDTFAREDFGTTLQRIKASFVDRDYEGIFTDTSKLQVYSAAYVPGRALCYYKIFCQAPLVNLWARHTKVYAVGAGSGSELVALSAAMTRVPAEKQRIALHMQDIGAWQDVLQQFETHTTRAWQIDDTQLTYEYSQGDILDPDAMHTTTADRIRDADLITFMFVMNELFVTKARAMQLIRTLVANMRPGAYLLVVESAGSFSHLKVGNRTYMVYTLLDALPDFERVLSDDARWYRCGENVQYPLPVANMRYFQRLYRKKRRTATAGTVAQQ